jgi:hypothetical protein
MKKAEGQKSRATVPLNISGSALCSRISACDFCSLYTVQARGEEVGSDGHRIPGGRGQQCQLYTRLLS